MNSLWGNLFKGTKKKKEQVMSVLRDIPMFQDLNMRELERVEHILHKRSYSVDEIIFSQNSMGAGMYIIVEGMVNIISEPGGEVLAELGDGEFFGELALIDESPRTATAVAKTPCSMLGFFQGDFFSLNERHPRLGIKIATRLSRIIGGRLVATNEQNVALQNKVEKMTQAQEENAG